MRKLHNIPALGAVLLVGWSAQAQIVSVVHANESVFGASNTGVKFLDRFTVVSGNYQIDSIGLYNPFGTPQLVDVYKNGVFSQSITGANGATGNVWKYSNLTTPIVVGAGDYVEVFFTNQPGTQNYAYAASAPTANFTVTAKYTTDLNAAYAVVRDSGAPWTSPVSTLGGIAVVPEPGEWTLVGAAAAGLAGLVIRRSRKG